MVMEERSFWILGKGDWFVLRSFVYQHTGFTTTLFFSLVSVFFLALWSVPCILSMSKGMEMGRKKES